MQPQQDETRRVNDFDGREPDRSGHVSGRRSYLKAALPIAPAGLLLGVANYLFFDPALLDSAPDLHLSQLVQGLLASLAVAILVVWYHGARRDPTFPRTSDALSLPLRGDRVRRHAQWFVQMRWVAVAVSLVLIFIAVFLSEILPYAALPTLLAWWVALDRDERLVRPTAAMGSGSGKGDRAPSLGGSTGPNGLAQCVRWDREPLLSCVYILQVIIAGIPLGPRRLFELVFAAPEPAGLRRGALLARSG